MIQYLQYVKFGVKVIEKKEKSCEYQKFISYEEASGGNAFGSPCNRHAARHGICAGNTGCSKHQLCVMQRFFVCSQACHEQRQDIWSRASKDKKR